MATIIRVSGADFSANAVGFLPPVSNGLLGWWHLGGTLANSQKNLATGLLSTVVGSPTVAAGFLTLGPSNYIDTGLAETNEWTFIVVAKNPAPGTAAANRPMYISNNLASPAIGAGLLEGGATAPAGSFRTSVFFDNGSGGTTQITAQAAATDVTVWHYVQGSASSTLARTVDKTTGAVATSALSGTRARNTSNTLRIGAAANNTGLAGTPGMAFAAIYNRALTSTEEAAVYATVKALMAAKSITV